MASVYNKLMGETTQDDNEVVPRAQQKRQQAVADVTSTATTSTNTNNDQQNNNGEQNTDNTGQTAITTTTKDPTVTPTSVETPPQQDNTETGKRNTITMPSFFNGQDEEYEVPDIAPLEDRMMEVPERTNDYEAFYKRLIENPTITEEQKNKMARRERAEKAIAGLGDVGAAIAQMVSANNGATPANVDAVNMSGKYAERWDKWRKKYQEELDKYQIGLQNAQKQDYAQYKADRDFALRYNKEQRIAYLKEIENERKNIELLLKQEKAKDDSIRNQARIDEYEARINYYDAMAARVRNTPVTGRKTGSQKDDNEAVDREFIKVMQTDERTLRDIADRFGWKWPKSGRLSVRDEKRLLEAYRQQKQKQ